MMAGKLWSTVLLSLALSGFFCEEVTISNSSQGTNGSLMINATSAAKSTALMSTVATTTIKDQSPQTPHIQENKTDRLENVTEVGPKITAGTTEPPTKIPMTSAFSLGPAILDQSSQSPENQTNTTVRLEKASEAGPKNNSILTNQEKQDDTSYSGIILPVVIALIVISVIVFLLMALYRMCLKTTPAHSFTSGKSSRRSFKTGSPNETFVNHTTPPNRAPSDKENVKLISVKTTSSDSAEQTSQGRNKTRQHNDSSSCQGNKCM